MTRDLLNPKNVFPLTPDFSPVPGGGRMDNRFNGLFGQAVETAFPFAMCCTRLKPRVNETKFPVIGA